MTGEELFARYAPDDAAWSPWAKPVLFAQIAGAHAVQAADLPVVDVSWAPEPRRTAVVVDLPGGLCVGAGIALARCGYRPVPLFNGCRGPKETIDTTPLLRALIAGASALHELRLTRDAPPAFLLDARRGKDAASPGDFDNRWVVFPQDFPSANLLLHRGIGSVVVFAQESRRPAADLAHVLRRWQDAGVALRAKDLGPKGPPVDLAVAKPSRFRAAWYRALALLGLGRSAAGGFGVQVPEPSRYRGGGYGGYGGFG